MLLQAKTKTGLALIALAGFVLLASPAAAEKANIVETAQSAGSFNTLLAAAKAAGLAETLAEGGPFTVFAPTDDAFKKLPAGTVESLLKPENKQQLADILKYHVVAGKVSSGQVLRAKRADSLLGPTILFSAAKGEVMADEAKIIQTDIQASNGVIHVIDSVILPKNTAERLSSHSQFSTLVAAAKAADLVAPLAGSDKLTVFAPTNKAFAALPAGTVESLLEPGNKNKLAAILKYHVVAGQKLLSATSLPTLQAQSLQIAAADIQVNEVKIEQVDIVTTNGVIHQIGRVLLPKMEQAQAADEHQAGPKQARELIRKAIARGAPMFNKGNAEACAAVYEVAAESLLTMEAVQGADRRNLKHALARVERMDHARREAWVLRHALDGVYQSMGRELSRMEE
ncbi:MAG: fasciclin domain-containing protein [Phycisphaerae bacterium]